MATKNGNSWTERQRFADTDFIVSAAVDIGARSGGIQVGGAYCAKLVLIVTGLMSAMPLKSASLV